MQWSSLICLPLSKRATTAGYERSKGEDLALSVSGPCAGEYGADVCLGSNSPFGCEWQLADGSCAETGPRITLPAGKHTARLRFEAGHEEEVQIEVTPSSWPTVLGYDVRHASGEWSRDGEVVLRSNVPASDHLLVAWTSGHLTEGPALEGVRPGIYAAVILRVNGRAVPSLHACAPAEVSAAPRVPQAELLLLSEEGEESQGEEEGTI